MIQFRLVGLLTLSIALSSQSYARLPTTEKEIRLWETSAERATCANNCEATQATRQCYVPNTRLCGCFSFCLETEGQKFIANLDSETSQSGAQKEAIAANSAASMDAAASGIVTVAIGAVELSEGIGAQKIGLGVDAIEAARALKEKENKIREALHEPTTALVANTKQLETPEAVEAFDKLERHYKIDRVDFQNRLLTSAPGAALKDMLSIDLEQLPVRSAQEDKTPSASASEGSQVSYGTKKVPMASGPKGLRAKIKERLEQQSEEVAVSEKKPALQITAPVFENLTAVGMEELTGNREPVTEELTIFDVVHRKYRERAAQLTTNKAILDGK